MQNQKKLILLHLILIFVLPISANSQTSPQPIAFSFTLSTNARTSAGVFQSNGTLIRTLWANKNYSSGSYIELWDGLTDDSTIAPANQTYQIKILSNNVKYTWEGVIGNTSDSLTGSTVLRAFDGIYDIAFAGNNMYYCTDYNEGWTAQYKTSVSTPQQKAHILEDYTTSQQTDYVATDGTYVYWGGCDGWSKAQTFVFATKVSDDTEVSFGNGISYKTAIGRTYKSVIDKVYGPNGTPATVFNALSTITGMTVQKTGSYLFVARSKMNRVDVINKTTGALIRTLSVTTPGDLTVDSNDNLWMVSGTNTLSKYTVNSNGTLSSPTISITGLLSPLAIAVSPNNNTIAVLDGSISQQVKAYNNITGGYLWTLGRAGGYQSDPIVYNDKFYFVDRSGDTTKNASTFRAFISFQPDGSFWVGDGGNYRVQHFSSGRTFLNNIMYINHTYSCAADPVNSTRVFNNFLEFKIDYSKPIAPNNGSWTLVKNWRDGVPTGYSYDKKVFNSMVTLSNGRTYAFLTNVANNSDIDIVELPATGNLRFTGIRLPKGVYKIYSDGSLKSFIHGAVGTQATWISQPLTGFDASNNPIWGTAGIIASIVPTSGNDPIDYNGGTPGNTTTSGLVISFDNEINQYGHGTDFHLGAIKLGSGTNNKFLWRTSQNTTSKYEGDFPDDGSYDIGNGVVYPGGDVWVVDNNIFWNYHGEFWKNSQTNKWNQYADIGLPIGQFGAVTDDYPYQEAFPLGAGNVLSAVFVKDSNGNYYLYHNDESIHGGLHRWKITGLNTIQVQTASFTSLSKSVPAGIDLLAGLKKFVVLADGTAGWNRNPKTEDYTSKASKYWSVKTTVKTFGYFTPNDIYIRYRQNSGYYSVTRDLGTNNVTSSWTLNGNISWDGNYENESNNTGGSYIEVLDNKGKIISRFYSKAISPNRYIYGNNSIIIQGSTTTIQSVTKHFQPINITVDGIGVTFTYANYSSVTAPIFDPSANWKTPKTLRFYFWTDVNLSNYDRIIDVQSMRFAINTTSPSNGPLNYYYRTVSSGNWSNLLTWQSSADSINWGNAAIAPSDSSNSITIQSGHTVNLTGRVKVDQLAIRNGGTLNVTPNASIIISNGPGQDINIASGGSMVIKSDVNGTGNIGNSLGTINGEVTVERYISSFKNAADRVLAPSVNTTNGTKPYIRDNWQEGQNNSNVNTNINLSPNYGTHITGSTVGAGGFDATSTGGISLFTFDQKSSYQTWVPVTNTNGINLDALKGYKINIIGDRSINLNANGNGLTTNTTLRTTGKILTGDQIFTNLESNGRVSLVTNPYACSISWDSIYNDNSTSNAANFQNYYIYFDPNVNTSGGYVNVNTSGVNSAAADGTLNIQPGQAFFVVAKPGVYSPSFTIRENHKSNTANVDVFRTTASAELKTKLFYTDKEEGRKIADGVTAVFKKGYAPEVDNNDAADMPNENENIAIERYSKMLSIEARPLPGRSDTFPLITERLKIRNYEWQFDPSQFNTNLPAFLEDKFLNLCTPISLDSQTVIPFIVTDNPASSSRKRFSIIFGTNNILSLQTLVNNETENFSIYPNPVTDHNVNLHFNKVNKGTYTVRLINSSGLTVTSEAINHPGGSATKTIAINNLLGRGIYIVSIIGNNKTEYKKIIIE